MGISRLLFCVSEQHLPHDLDSSVGAVTCVWTTGTGTRTVSTGVHGAAVPKSCVLYAMLCCQVSVAEERHRNLKEALEVDIASIGGQADKIKVCITLNA